MFMNKIVRREFEAAVFAGVKTNVFLFAFNSGGIVVDYRVNMAAFMLLIAEEGFERFLAVRTGVNAFLKVATRFVDLSFFKL